MSLDMKELNLQLYLERTYSGPKANQLAIVKPIGTSFTSMVISDWALYENRSPNAGVVARAQGLHIQAGISSECWYNSFNIVFQEGSRFEDSTLQVMGVVVEDGEWAIVGGTGEFNMAQGVIYKKRVDQRNDGDTVELTIRGFYSTLQKPITLSNY